MNELIEANACAALAEVEHRKKLRVMQELDEMKAENERLRGLVVEAIELATIFEADWEEAYDYRVKAQAALEEPL